MKHILFLAFFLVDIALHAFEFSDPFPTEDYPYKVHKSDEEVCTDCPSVVAWLDNDRVIFTRLKKGEPFLQMQKYVDGIYSGETVIWDTKKDKVIPYHDGMLWCSYGGYLSIFYNPGLKSPDNVRVLKGFLGKEIDKKAWKQGDPIIHNDRYTCVSYAGPSFEPDTPDWTYPLREEDGVIDIGRVKWQFPLSEADQERIKKGGMPVAVIRPNGTRIKLSLGINDVQGVWWDEWAGVYILKMFLYGAVDVPKIATRPDTLVYLYPDGTLGTYALPLSYWWTKKTARAAITKKGIVVVNEQADVFPAGKRSSGAYLVRGDKMVRLNDWYVGNEKAGYNNIHRGFAVSPDGCKIAYKHTDGPRYKTVSTIQMINLCEGDE